MLPLIQRWQARPGLAATALAIGVAIWLCGIFDVFGRTSILSGLSLLVGVFIALPAALLLLLPRADRDLPNSQVSADGVLAFSLLFGVGLVAVGMALPDTFALPVRLIFGIGGLALIAWSPQALRRFRDQR